MLYERMPLEVIVKYNELGQIIPIKVINGEDDSECIQYRVR